MTRREFKIQLRKILLNSEKERYSTNFYRFIVIGVVSLIGAIITSFSISGNFAFLSFLVPGIFFWKAFDYKQMSNQRDKQIRAITVNEINDVIKGEEQDNKGEEGIDEVKEIEEVDDIKDAITAN